MFDKNSIIEKILVPYLKNEGFDYCGYKDKSWIFRKKGDVNQEILLLEYRYDSSYYTLLLSGTSAVSASMLDSSDKFMNEYWYVKDIDAFENLMIHIRELLKTKGLSMLEEISIPDDTFKIINRISKEVFENRKIIYDYFIKNYPQIPIDDYSLENINKWFEFFENEYSFYKCADAFNLSTKDIMDIEEVVTFLSTMIEVHLSGLWIKFENGDDYSVIIDEISSLNKSINVVAIIFSTINRNSIQSVKMIFEDLYNNRISK